MSAVTHMLSTEPVTRRRRGGELEGTLSSPGMVYESGRRRREEILDAATKLFGEYAYSGVSMRDVAAETGVTHAGLRYHFPSKDDLLLAVLERHSDLGDEYYDRAFEYVQQTPPDVWGVLEEFVGYLQYSLSQRLKAQMFIMHAILAADPDHAAHDFFERRYRNIREQFTQVIGALVDHGFMREELVVEEAATELIAMADGLQVQWLISPTSVPYKTIIESAVRRLINDEFLETYDQFVQSWRLPEPTEFLSQKS